MNLSAEQEEKVQSIYDDYWEAVDDGQDNEEWSMIGDLLRILEDLGWKSRT
jgi:hypothetical protein